MAKKPVPHVKHIPQRTCVGCRAVMAKRQLLRVVRTANGVQVDLTGKLAGRGAYVHDRRSCWQAALQGSLGQALKLDLTADDRRRLETFLNSLPQSGPGEQSM